MTLHNPYLHVDEYNNPGNVRFQEFSQNDVGRNYCRFMGWGGEKEKKTIIKSEFWLLFAHKFQLFST